MPYFLVLFGRSHQRKERKLMEHVTIAMTYKLLCIEWYKKKKERDNKFNNSHNCNDLQAIIRVVKMIRELKETMNDKNIINDLLTAELSSINQRKDNNSKFQIHCDIKIDLLSCIIKENSNQS